jgi:hypothetical protein
LSARPSNESGTVKPSADMNFRVPISIAICPVRLG